MLEDNYLTEEQWQDMNNVIADAEFERADKENISPKKKERVYSVEEITKQVEAVAKKHLGDMFRFRENQKEAIVSIVYNWLTGCDDIVCSAPTGSGKSIIALLAASVLTTYYQKRGYILISDLSLIQQYENDVEKYFPEWSVIKGQQTYKCDVNGLPFTMGACKMKGCKSYSEIFRKFRSCAEECLYIQERNKAIGSSLLVCTYSFWLIQQNLVKMKMEGEAPFTERDFTICDEAHKLVSIVQGHFSPKIMTEDMNKFNDILMESGNDDGGITINKIAGIRSAIKVIDDNDNLYECLNNYVDSLKLVEDSIDTINRAMSAKTDNKQMLSKEDRRLIAECNYVTDHIGSFRDYLEIIEKAGTQTIVKNPQDMSDNIVFNCLDESYLMGKCFHRHCKKKMYMSATIGDHEIYASECGFDKHHYVELPSTFDFTNSPIYYVPDYKMSYAEKDRSLPYITKMINSILHIYAGQRGIIQTGSYQFAHYLYDNAGPDVKKRLVMYDGSQQKAESLEFFKKMKDKVLIGPSLVEGLSFDDDLARFQIVMKIPYPSLKDKFVSAKQNIKPEWYTSTTAISMLQGFGRGIRNEHDWCVTFVVDGCFGNLLRTSYSMFPKYVINRLQPLSANVLIGNSL